MPNSTRSANEAMSIIARRIAERAAAINLAPADEIGPMCEMVTTFLDQMMAGISSTEASRLLYRMIDRIDFLGDNLLQSVNPPAQRTAFQDHIGQVFARFANGRSVHLELGVWTAWPEERVQQHVGPDKLGDIIRLDMNPTFPVDVAASVTALPFRDNSIDCISSNSLFEHVPYPHDILREAFRVLRAGGALRTTVPFHFVEHGCPKDYLRFTGQFFEDVCADIGFTDIKTDTRSTSGMLYTIHQLSKAALVNTDAPDAGPARRAHVAIMSILGVCQALDSSFVAGGASHWHSTDMIAVKPGNYVAPDYAPDHSKHFLDRHDHILACPLTGDSLIRQGETLATRRGASYKIVNGVPNMVMMQGQSSFSVIAKRLHDLQRKVRELQLWANAQGELLTGTGEIWAGQHYSMRLNDLQRKQHYSMLSRSKRFLRRIVGR
jgi:SAM-dependent methyltransferase